MKVDATLEILRDKHWRCLEGLLGPGGSPGVMNTIDSELVDIRAILSAVGSSKHQ